MIERSILIAEDDHLLREVLQTMFEDENFTVYLASDGSTALEYYNRQQPQILLMDIDMPEKNGWEVLEQIRKNDSLLPVIIMSGRKTSEADSLKSYDLGVDAFVRKPFSPKEMIAQVNVLFNRRYDIAEIISLGHCRLNMSSRILQLPGKAYILTRTEAEVLYLLGKNKGNPVETKNILHAVWRHDSDGNHQTLRNTITRLRKLLKEENRIKIDSIYGEGYLLKFPV
ncbi:DNA-binding response regulator [Bacteroidia bacterium]|nr:DNA-binding response regulator [Bacteroidia bacterium]